MPLCEKVGTATTRAEINVGTLAILGFGLHPPLFVSSGCFGGRNVALTAVADMLASSYAVGIVFLHLITH